ncbi:MAG TPA: BON domain-containing protein [Gammaproteobacteria bacterium]|jgi:osmotically-inducible protein OsmY
MIKVVKDAGKVCFMILLGTGLFGCAGTDTRQSTGEYIDDAAITSKVKSELLRDDRVSGLAVEVETYKGVVQLSGFVDSADERRRAEELAEEVNGVRNVRNDIQVK